MAPEKRNLPVTEDDTALRLARTLEQLEAERRSAQERKMEAIGRLAAGVAHDFNNLLTAILGYSNLAMLKLGERDRTREDVAQIRLAGERAVELTQQLLAFSRRQMLSPTVIDLGVMARDMETLLRRLIGEGVELILSGDQPLRPVKADLGQMEQVLVNLAANARDAMPQGGKLAVETRNVPFAGGRPPAEGMVPGEYVMLAVSDTGSGMDEGIRSHLFEPFFTTKARGKGQGKSQGLGLAAAYGFITQSGGYLRVNTEPGRGSAFRIYLPAAAPARLKSDPVLPEAQRASPAGGETILVVEDEKAVRSFLREALERSGYLVLEAENGEEALAKAAEAAYRGATLPGNEGEIRLLLTDMVMGGMNGRELADEVSGLLPGIKVLYISGFPDRAIVHDGIIAEGLAFLRKPFTPLELARKIRSVLDGG